MKIAIMHTMIAIYTWLPTYLMQSSMGPKSKANAVLKVPFLQKLRCVFQISKKIIPNHYSEHEI